MKNAPESKTSGDHAAHRPTSQGTENRSPADVERRSLEVGKWANLAMAVAGVAAAYISHSDALLVDGLYSGVNFVSAIIAARIGASIRKTADRRYPFGYDAYEALYVKYRSLVLLGIMLFAAFGATSKIIVYTTGGAVPELVFGPILAYMGLMVAICCSLAYWHHRNWKRSGTSSELLKTESKASIVDGLLSAGAGGGLLGSALLRGTSLDFIVPVSDSIVVLVLCAFMLRQPMKMFISALREVAGGSADPELVEQVRTITVELANSVPAEVLEVTVTKLGRTFFAVPYLNPKNPVAATQIDTFRLRLQEAYTKLLGSVRTEIIITAQHPYVLGSPESR